jgi:hypothetical protein
MATVSFVAGDLYDAGAFSLKEEKAGVKSGALTPLYTLSPRDIPFARDLRIQIGLPTTTTPIDKLGIYRRQGAHWAFEGNDAEKDWRALTATIRSAGAFAILADRHAPVISNVIPGKDAVIRDSRPTIRFDVTDGLSGIGSEDDLQMTIDDRWVPVEYDPDLRAAKTRPRWELDPGIHHIEIVARDRCGNESRLVRAFTVRR